MPSHKVIRFQWIFIVLSQMISSVELIINIFKSMSCEWNDHVFFKTNVKYLVSESVLQMYYYWNNKSSSRSGIHIGVMSSIILLETTDSNYIWHELWSVCLHMELENLISYVIYGYFSWSTDSDHNVRLRNERLKICRLNDSLIWMDNI